MRMRLALVAALTGTALALLAPACSSSSSSSSSGGGDSGSGTNDTGTGDDSTSSSSSGSGADTGAPGDTGSPSDSGSITDAHGDAVDAPYCAVVQGLIDAGAVGQGAGACLDQCCAMLTTCVQSTECKTLFRCVSQCSKTTDAGAAACISMCEADASSQASTELNQLATCLATAGCGP